MITRGHQILRDYTQRRYRTRTMSRCEYRRLLFTELPDSFYNDVGMIEHVKSVQETRALINKQSGKLEYAKKANE